MTNPENVEITFKALPKAMDALTRASITTGLNNTDTLNRAIQLYDFITNVIQDGKTQLAFTRPDGGYIDIIKFTN